jgi:hypothetical protein
LDRTNTTRRSWKSTVSELHFTNNR